MMDPKYFFKYSIETLAENNESYFSHFEKLSNSLTSLFVNRIREVKTEFKDERIYFLNLITQKFLLHVNSIKKLAEGIKIESIDINLSLLDPFSIHTLTRTVIETYLVQNYLSNRSEDEDLLNARFEIWMRQGLKNRNMIPENKEEEKISNLDKKSIQLLEKSIKKRSFFSKLSNNNQASFLKQIDRGWKFTFNDDEFQKVGWKELLKLSGMKSSIYDNIYNFLSWHVHSQSISILQLKNMWDDDFDKISIRTSINKLNMFIAFLISDITYSDIDFKNAYDNLDNDLKELINFYNLAYRDEEFIIN